MIILPSLNLPPGPFHLPTYPTLCPVFLSLFKKQTKKITKKLISKNKTKTQNLETKIYKQKIK